MISVRRLLVSAVLAGLLISLPGCHKPTPVHQLGPFYIMLTYNNGSCQQNGSSGIIDIPYDQNIIYQGAAALTQFQVNFSADCPFAQGNCPVNSPNGNPDNVGQPNGNAKGNSYNYGSMMINNQQCTMGGPMGVRVKPGP